ncbi:hypothetical protein [Bacillus sp. FSL K6-3431]|uniref:hypothetical protein n=1 Tax=Bacillus sp. FSL K6-3431 TaxID=2921500 RepID=UPI0030F652B3
MQGNYNLEIIYLPSKFGMVKVYVYGFKTFGAWGQVFATLDDISVNVKGYNRKKTIVRSLTSLNESLLNMKEE